MNLLRLSKHPAFLCALALVICVGLSYPILNMGMYDDWSYIWSARILADTGHFTYNGWAAMMLGWQLYLGALFIKLFGFSFTVVRASMLVVSIGAVVIIQRLFVLFGINEWNSSIATLTIALSPPFLLFSFSFMSDVPGFFCLVLCLYCCTRATQAVTDRAAIGWLVFAALSNLLDGTVRQIVWLGALVIVPSAAWNIRRRHGVLATGAILWVVSIPAILACLHWFHRQPYTFLEKIEPIAIDRDGLVDFRSVFTRSFLATCLVISPVLIAFLAKYPFSYLRARRQAIVAGALSALVILFLILRNKPVYWLAPFFDYHITTTLGLFGALPAVPFSIRIILTLITFASIIPFLLVLWNASSLKTRASQAAAQPPLKTILTLLAPFALSYLFLVGTQKTIFERYLLPLFFVILVPILRLYQSKIADRLPMASLLLLLLCTAYSVAGMHDVFAADRARVAAADEVRASGVPRSAIRGGLDYDGWTQLESTGHVNNIRVRNPPDAFRPTIPVDVLDECSVGWFSTFTPAIVPQYALSAGPSTCYKPSRFPPVPYSTWIPPHDHAIYIRSLR